MLANSGAVSVAPLLLTYVSGYRGMRTVLWREFFSAGKETGQAEGQGNGTKTMDRWVVGATIPDTKQRVSLLYARIPQGIILTSQKQPTLHFITYLRRCHSVRPHLTAPFVKHRCSDVPEFLRICRTSTCFFIVSFFFVFPLFFVSKCLSEKHESNYSV